MEVIPAIKTATSRDFYLAYLNSAEWKSKRNAALRRFGFRCERCNAKRDLQVHHKTYERMGYERDADLEVLCVDCHEGATIAATEQSDNRIYLRLASSALKKRPYADVGELSEDVKRLCVQHRIGYRGDQVHRALELLTGTRLTRQDAKRRDPDYVPDPQAVSAQDAHEILTRIGFTGSMDILAKAMPATQQTPQQEATHEARVLEQARAFRQIPQKRRSFTERLAEIFS